MKQADFASYKWIHESSVRFTDDAMILYAPPKTDYFCDPSEPIATSGILPDSLNNAPFFYREVTGDFVLRVQVQHDFLYTYDAATLMVMKDDTMWAKACWEKTDFDTHAVVSVVTNGVSDDANGCNIESDTVWLQMVRVKDNFGLQYSLDGVKFDMMRYFYLPVGETAKVGFVAQSPQGEGGDRIFRHVSLERRTVSNLRAGV